MAERRIEMHLDLARGSAYLRETAPDRLILSWYPDERDDANYPGLVIDTSQLEHFPHAPALVADSVAVQDWIEAQEWARTE
jgi:hypothetical protein